jgi:hypothetical protein
MQTTLRLLRLQGFLRLLLELAGVPAGLGRHPGSGYDLETVAKLARPPRGT